VSTHRTGAGGPLAVASALMIVLAAPFSELDAQSPDLVADRTARIAATLRLHPGQQVRLALPGAGRVPGEVTRLPGGLLTVLAKDDQRELSLGLADTVWVRKTAWVPGLVIGGVLGAAFGAFAGAVAQGVCDYDCPSTGEVIGVSVVTAALGAGLGAGIGALIPKWKRSWIGEP
jgi:hypothetical protein